MSIEEAFDTIDTNKKGIRYIENEITAVII